jgi:hypothetical protein
VQGDAASPCEHPVPFSSDAMRWFLDRPIGTKLILAFVLVSTCSAAAGVKAWLTLRSMAAADRVLYANMTVPLAQIGFAAKQFQRVRVNVRDAIFNSITKEELALSNEAAAARAREGQRLRVAQNT